jgi:hypothetical protein
MGRLLLAGGAARLCLFLAVSPLMQHVNFSLQPSDQCFVFSLATFAGNGLLAVSLQVGFSLVQQPWSVPTARAISLRLFWPLFLAPLPLRLPTPEVLGQPIRGDN